MRLALFALAITAAGPIARADGPQASQPLPPQTLTLDEALQRAVKAAPSVSHFEHLSAAASERVREAQSGLMPSLAIQGAATDGPAGAPAFGSPGLQGLAGDPLKKHFGGGLNVLLPLYDFGRTQHLVGARRALLEAARADVATQQANVILSVQEAYLDVLRRQQLVGVQQANVRQREATVTQARAHVEAGLRAEVDLTLAQANLEEARVALTATENDLHLAFANLNNAMGETKLTEYRLEPPAPPSVAVPPSDTSMRQAVAQRPELQNAAQQVISAEQSVRAAQSELLPRVDSIASVGAVNPGKLIAENKNYAVGLMLTVPLYTGGAVEGRIAEERERRAAAEAARREVEEAIKLQVARAWLNVQTRTTQLRSAQAQAEAARSSLQQATERYRLQLNTFEELLSAEAAGVRAETAIIDAQYDLQQARAELDWASGAVPGVPPRTQGAPVRRK